MRTRTLLAAAIAIFGVVAAPAAAHVSPAGCTSSGASLSINKNRTSVRNGDVVTFTVQVSNVGVLACDVSGATVTVRLPAADGTPTGELRTIAQNATYPAGSFQTVGPVNYTAALSPGVSAFAVSVSLTGTAHDSAGDSTAQSAGSITTASTQPLLALTLAPSPTTSTVPFNVTYTYVLTNRSTTVVPMTSPAISDSGCSPVAFSVGDTNANARLDNGEAWTFNCAHLFTSAGMFTSTATAGATSTVDSLGVFAGPVQSVVTANPAAPVPTPTHPHLVLTKTASPDSGVAPLTVTYTNQVVNDGDVPIAGVSVNDFTCAPAVRTGADAGGDGILSVGESWTFTCSTVYATARTVTGSAVASGSNTADGQPVSSNLSSTTVKVNAANVLPAPTPDPTDPVDPDPDPTPTPTPPSRRVVIAFGASFRVPAGKTRAQACRGRVVVTLKAGTISVTSKTVVLRANCRWTVRFDVLRSRLRGSRTVTLNARFGKRKATYLRSVPK